jgi:hypothetical protein
MVDQHYRSQLSQETVQCRPASSGNIVLIKRLGFSTDPQGLIVPGAGISSNSWNGSPGIDRVSLQFTSGLRRPSYILTPIQANTIVNRYSPVPGRSPNQHPTLPSNEVCHVHSDTIGYLNNPLDIRPHLPTNIDDYSWICVPSQVFFLDRTRKTKYPIRTLKWS